MEIVKQAIGSEADLVVKFEDLALKIQAHRKGGIGDTQDINVEIPVGVLSDKLLDFVEELIPGDQKAMFAIIKEFLKGKLAK